MALKRPVAGEYYCISPHNCKGPRTYAYSRPAMSGVRNRVLLNSDLLNGVQSLDLLLIEMTGPVLAHGHNQTVSTC